VLAEHPTTRGLLQAVLILGVVWWMYGGYTWLTNAERTDAGGRRLLLLGGMAGFMIQALCIPTAFSGDGLVFGIGYLVVICVHGTLFMRSAREATVSSFRRLALYNLAIAALVLIGGGIGGAVEYVAFAAAFAVAWIVPKRGVESGFEIAPAHFVERHGLVVIIAIGESVIAVGIGAQELVVEAGMIAVALLGLALSACLWWAYFGGDDARAERALTDAPAARRPALALAAYGYWHIPILLGIVATASALEVAIAHPTAGLSTARALALGGGVGLYMVGDALFRRSLGLGPLAGRLGAAALALATVPIGTELSAIVQLIALVVVLAAILANDRPQAARAAAV